MAKRVLVVLGLGLAAALVWRELPAMRRELKIMRM